MQGPLIFIATNRLKPGRLDSERARVPGLVEFVEANEPRLIAAIMRSTRSVQSRTPTRSRQPPAEKARRAASCNTRAIRRATSRRTTAARGTDRLLGGHSRTLGQPCVLTPPASGRS